MFCILYLLLGYQIQIIVITIFNRFKSNRYDKYNNFCVISIIDKSIFRFLLDFVGAFIAATKSTKPTAWTTMMKMRKI